MSYIEPIQTAEDILGQIDKIGKGPNHFEDDAFASYLAWCTEVATLAREWANSETMTEWETLARQLHNKVKAGWL